MFYYPRSRMLEREADKVGLQIAAKVIVSTVFCYSFVYKTLKKLLIRPALTLDLLLFFGVKSLNLMIKQISHQSGAVHIRVIQLGKWN